MRLNIVFLVIRLLLIAGLLIVYGCGSSGGSSDSDASATTSREPTFWVTHPLTADDVRTIIAQTVTEAVNRDVAVTVVVTDRGGNVLGAFRMTDAAPLTTIDGDEGTLGQGLEGIDVPARAGCHVESWDGGVLRHLR